MAPKSHFDVPQSVDSETVRSWTLHHRKGEPLDSGGQQPVQVALELFGVQRFTPIRYEKTVHDTISAMRLQFPQRANDIQVRRVPPFATVRKMLLVSQPFGHTGFCEERSSA
jgi:hypothetical protein